MHVGHKIHTGARGYRYIGSVELDKAFYKACGKPEVANQCLVKVPHTKAAEERQDTLETNLFMNVSFRQA